MTRLVLAACAVALSTALGVPAGHAQQEVQVPLDREGRIEVVDARMAERLGVFVDRFPGFQEARLLVQIPDSVHILEITMRRDGRTVRDRRPQTPSEVDALRADLGDRIAALAPGVAVDREGRHRLLGGTTLLGLAFYGWAVPEMLDVDDPTTTTGLYMLTAGSSFFGPWIATRHRAVTRGTADLAMYGGTRGILHGLLAHLLVTGGEDDDPERNDDIRGELAAATAFSVAEGLGGYAWARRRGFDLAATRTIGMAGDFGLLQGLALAGLVDAGDRAAAGSVLAGGSAGLLVGHRLRARREYSAGDVTVLATGGYLGAYAGLAVADVAASGSDRWYGAGAMAGSAVGLLGGDRLVRPVRFTEGQGRLVALGTVAGGAVGMGVAHLIVGENGGSDDSAIYLAASTVGAAAGYGLTYRSLAPDAARPGFPTGNPGSLELHLNPMGLLPARSAGAASPEALRRIPLLTGAVRF